MSSSNNDASTPQACIDGCGFFASAATDRCSACHRKHMSESMQDLASGGQDAPSSPAAWAAAAADAAFAASNVLPAEGGDDVASMPAPMDVAPAETEAVKAPAMAAAAADETPKKKKKKKARCAHAECRTKIGTRGFECACGASFCGSHRYAWAHDCTHDFAAEARDRLRAANPVVSPEKVARI
ncbi:uncharacterized protein AMSG_01621 [Thecamonas trahens ATCC 50062]|uniref:AN1-type domain-containing protein n=1 Tax=Thecamonas trahens ATCC 50062 TaxID=461836 RepID=A0A0L0DR32_THETB|nr:hypothetical protein AMSG_01621 [Thecamonas trahens ATCC 50062]KNC54769.1 hypothetical protein AMSG_01621 [Thecamonas trahens ATCC 50062]|eukprot:XP_013761669.1 hypothetical protein AMSG_01621 [Thecamonas trahens ATCC 50062]